MDEKKPGEFKSFLFRVFESHDPRDKLCLAFDIFYIIQILLAVTLSILEVTEVWGRHLTVFEIIEYSTVVVFIIEWLSSLYTADLEHKELSRGKAMLKWLFSLESIIDITCLVTLITMLILRETHPEIGFVEYLALIKVIRLYKLIKYPVAYWRHLKKSEEK